MKRKVNKKNVAIAVGIALVCIFVGMIYLITLPSLKFALQKDRDKVPRKTREDICILKIQASSSQDSFPMFSIQGPHKMNKEGFGGGEDFWNHPSGPVKITFVKQGQFCFSFFKKKELCGYLNETEGLTYQFTYVGKVYVSFSSLWKKASWEGSEATLSLL